MKNEELVAKAFAITCLNLPPIGSKKGEVPVQAANFFLLSRFYFWFY